jgi:undecaprenyl diphosphate synthase
MSITKEEIISTGSLPSHIAIIMDGNGRWAKKQGAERIFGHLNGVSSVRNASEACAELGIKYLTLYAFSTENWSRPKEEVDALMRLLVNTISDEIPTLHKNNISLHAIGNLEQLPDDCRNQLLKGVEETKHHDGMKLILALSYSSKWDILESVKKISEKVKSGVIEVENITEDLFKAHLTTANFPDPELMIRTSGEYRISNFLLWELAYAELYFCPKLWPEFEKEDLYQALQNYQHRERRFGKISEQVNPS